MRNALNKLRNDGRAIQDDEGWRRVGENGVQVHPLKGRCTRRPWACTQEAEPSTPEQNEYAEQVLGMDNTTGSR